MQRKNNQNERVGNWLSFFWLSHKTDIRRLSNTLVRLIPFNCNRKNREKKSNKCLKKKIPKASGALRQSQLRFIEKSIRKKSLENGRKSVDFA